jgi:hypothetical protein
MEFDHAPEKPANEEAARGFAVLDSARTAASSFMTLHDADQGGKESDEAQQDLLWAALLFAAAGVDSMVKQLIADALPAVIERSEGARAKLEDYVDRRLRRDDQSGTKLLAAALASTDARSVIVDALVRELRSTSLQSVEELSRAVAYFDIPTVDVIEDAAGLGDVDASWCSAKVRTGSGCRWIPTS